jgi:RNA polymerase sigma-70 factor, ECF subfamily
MTFEAAGVFPMGSELETADLEESAAVTSSDRPIANPSSDPCRVGAYGCIPTFEISDGLLLEKIQQGDTEALAILFRRHARAVRNVAQRILHNEAEADDLVQEVFLFIFRKADLFNDRLGSARSWIFQVAYHRAFDRRRYLHSRHFYTSQDLEEPSRRLTYSMDNLLLHEQSIEGLLGKQLAARFRTHLTPEQRETIQLFFLGGYTLKEIAQLTGRALANVRQHYYRGLARLRKNILPRKLLSK